MSLHPEGIASTSNPFKCKAKRDILRGICVEESANAASFPIVCLTAPISVIPAYPILTSAIQHLTVSLNKTIKKIMLNFSPRINYVFDPGKFLNERGMYKHNRSVLS